MNLSIAKQWQTFYRYTTRVELINDIFAPSEKLTWIT